MLTVKEIREKLKECNLNAVSRDTGLHIQTLYKIKNESPDPRHSTVLILSEYFTSQGS